MALIELRLFVAAVNRNETTERKEGWKMYMLFNKCAVSVVMNTGNIFYLSTSCAQLNAICWSER